MEENTQKNAAENPAQQNAKPAKKRGKFGEFKKKSFTVGSQLQATTTRNGITRSEVYECIAFDDEKQLVTVINDQNREATYYARNFRTMKDDFAGMFCIDD